MSTFTCKSAYRDDKITSDNCSIVPVAQWIEQLPSKQWVVGSNPSRDAIYARLKTG